MNAARVNWTREEAPKVRLVKIAEKMVHQCRVTDKPEPADPIRYADTDSNPGSYDIQSGWEPRKGK